MDSPVLKVIIVCILFYSGFIEMCFYVVEYWMEIMDDDSSCNSTTSRSSWNGYLDSNILSKICKCHSVLCILDYGRNGWYSRPGKKYIYHVCIKECWKNSTKNKKEDWKNDFMLHHVFSYIGIQYCSGMEQLFYSNWSIHIIQNCVSSWHLRQDRDGGTVSSIASIDNQR